MSFSPDNNEQNFDSIEPSHEHGALLSFGLFILELIKVALLAGLTIWLVRYFLFKPFYVKGQSMEPNFYEKEYLIIDELTYRFREPSRGEVIVLKAPAPVEKDYYLKRIVGLPGEKISVQENKVIVYNREHPEGKVVEENYLTETTPGSISITLGSDQYFVLGDNRDASFDSRRFGAIRKDDIIGRTWIRGWPILRASIISAPKYNF
jgi:signal peptidase I